MIETLSTFLDEGSRSQTTGGRILETRSSPVVNRNPSTTPSSNSHLVETVKTMSVNTLRPAIDPLPLASSLQQPRSKPEGRSIREPIVIEDSPPRLVKTEAEPSLRPVNPFTSPGRLSPFWSVGVPKNDRNIAGSGLQTKGAPVPPTRAILNQYHVAVAEVVYAQLPAESSLQAAARTRREGEEAFCKEQQRREARKRIGMKELEEYGLVQPSLREVIEKTQNRVKIESTSNSVVSRTVGLGGTTSRAGGRTPGVDVEGLEGKGQMEGGQEDQGPQEWAPGKLHSGNVIPRNMRVILPRIHVQIRIAPKSS